jgi:acyl carrier protein
MGIENLLNEWLRMLNYLKTNLTIFDLMEEKDIAEMKDIVLNYVIKEYVDSFSLVLLLVILGNRFKIKIQPSKATAEAFDSVNCAVALINPYMK